MAYLFLDWETTGFAKGGEYVQEGQGRGCQLSMILTDEQGASISEISSLITPEGWRVSDEAWKIHGFTTERCAEYGLPGAGIVRAFLHLASKAKLLIAHNSDFDKKFCAIECAYSQRQMPEKTWFCTMTSAARFCKIPPTEAMVKKNMKCFKNPSLEEAYSILCGKKLEKAHDAAWDSRACRDIFFEILRLQKAETQPPAQGDLIHGTT